MSDEKVHNNLWVLPNMWMKSDLIDSKLLVSDLNHY